MNVSIIIPVKNGGDLFEEVIKAILNQKVDFFYELIIIDSGSEDSSADFIRDIAVSNDNVRLYEIDPKKFGHGATRNLGVKLAKGKNLVFTTQDALPCNSSWLSSLIAPLDENEDVAGVFGRHYPHRNAWPLESFLVNHHFKELGKKRIKYKITHELDYRQRYGWYLFYSDNNSCMRKEVLEKIPFREVPMGEDQWWAKDILEAGLTKIYEPNAAVYHSHNYGFWDTYSRHFLEYAFYHDIGIINKTGIKQSLKYFISLTSQSINATFSAHINVRSKLNFTFFYLIRALFATAGFHNGLRKK